MITSKISEMLTDQLSIDCTMSTTSEQTNGQTSTTRGQTHTTSEQTNWKTTNKE